MKDHPMLLMRDPPPEIDVTRPALPKRIRLADLVGGATSETVDNTAHGYLDGSYFVVSTPTTIEFTTFMDPNSWHVESAAQAQEARSRSLPFKSSDDPAGNVCSRESSRVGDSVPEPVAADPDGWIEWQGGECPVALDTRVDVALRNGTRTANSRFSAGAWVWSHFGISGDIMAYKVLP